jgi:hypothetical protein
MKSEDKGKIICRCGTVLFDGLILKKLSVGQFSNGFMNLKCKDCKSWLDGINTKVLTGEINTTIDFRKEAKHSSN